MNLFMKRRFFSLTGARLLGGVFTPNKGLYADQEISELVSLCPLSQLFLAYYCIYTFISIQLPNCFIS